MKTGKPKQDGERPATGRIVELRADCQIHSGATAGADTLESPRIRNALPNPKKSDLRSYITEHVESIESLPESTDQLLRDVIKHDLGTHGYDSRTILRKVQSSVDFKSMVAQADRLSKRSDHRSDQVSGRMGLVRAILQDWECLRLEGVPAINRARRIAEKRDCSRRQVDRVVAQVKAAELGTQSDPVRRKRKD
jgi:hypothetical protein